MVKKLPLILLIFFSLMSLNDLQAQKRNFVQNFVKDSFKLNYNTNPPEIDTLILQNSSNFTYEPVSICNKNGEARFFYNTFSRKIFNRYGVEIPGTQPQCGQYFYIFGTSNRTSFFVPHSTDTNIYYLIYSCYSGVDPNIDYRNKVYFAEINQSLNNGIGGIVFSDSLLDDSAGIFLAPAYHDDGKSIWIAYQNINSDTNEMRFLLFKDGIYGLPKKFAVHNLRGSLNQFATYQNFFQFNPQAKYFLLYDRFYNQNDSANFYYFNDSTGDLSLIKSFKKSVVFSDFSFTPLGTNVVNYNISWSSTGTNFFNLFDFADPLNTGNIVNFRSLKDSIYKNHILQGLNQAHNIDIQINPYGEMLTSHRFSENTSLGTYFGITRLSGVNTMFTPFVVDSNYFDDINYNSGYNDLMDFIRGVPYQFDIRCANDTSSFEYEGLLFDSIWWDFDDPLSGSENIKSGMKVNHIFKSAGLKNIKLMLSDGYAIDTIIFKRTIKGTIYPPENLDTFFCRPNFKLVDYSSRPGLKLWSDGDTNSIKILDTTGIYSLKLDDNGCITLDTFRIISDPVKVNSKIINPVICKQNEIIISDSTLFADSLFYLYQSVYFSDTVGTKFIINSGNIDTFKYQVLAKSDSGCYDTLSVSLKNNNLPKANPVLSLRDFCRTQNQINIKTNLIPDNGIKPQFQWSFLLNPRTWDSTYTMPKLWDTAGKYDFKLLLKNQFQCTDSIDLTLNVLQNSEIDFQTSRNVLCEKDSFSVLVQVGPETRYWTLDFPDFNLTDSLRNLDTLIKYTFDTTSRKTYRIFSESNFGCKDTLIRNLDIHPKPFAQLLINDSSICENEALICRIDTIGNKGKLLDWELIFEPGHSSFKSFFPRFIFNRNGQANLELKLQTDKGCRDSIFKNIILFKKPDANFVALDSSLCLENGFIRYQDQCQPGDAPLRDIYWGYSNNKVSGILPTSTFDIEPENGGGANAYIAISDYNNCSDTFSRFIPWESDQNWVLSWSDTNLCSNEGTLDILDQSPFQGWTNYTIFWGDGNQSTASIGNRFSHRYNDTGDFLNRLEIITANNCKHTREKLITVHPSPEAFFSDSFACKDQDLFIENLSTIRKGFILESTWDFNGLFTYPWDAGHTINSNEPGNREISLTVISDWFCEDTYTRNIFIYRPPQKTIQTKILDWQEGRVVMEFLGFPEGNNNDWEWHVENEIELANPYVHSFSDTGQYFYWVKVNDLRGCDDSIGGFLYVYPELEVYVPSSFSPDGNGKNDGFKTYGAEYSKEFEFQIFDRWGNLIFQTKNPNLSWDGINNGKPATIGMYMYLLKTKNWKDEPKIYKGTFMLIR